MRIRGCGIGATLVFLGLFGAGIPIPIMGQTGETTAEKNATADAPRWDLLTRDMGPAETDLEIYKKVRRFLDPDSPDPDADPEGYARAFNAHYGLHPAPFPNDGLPMGLIRGTSYDGSRPGIRGDCLACHGGSIGGTSYVGLGNTQLDLKALMYEFAEAAGEDTPFVPFTINSVRGTNNAWQFTVALFALRNPDMSTRRFPRITGAYLPETDTPAWWILKKKRTKYYTGYTSADSHRSNMQFLMGVPQFGGEDFATREPMFRELDAMLKTIEPPPYPFPIDQARADRGRAIFERECATCHGTYGDDWTYPNKIVPLDVIGTDPTLARNLTPAYVKQYNESFFADPYPMREDNLGYQAPPLDGIWATAPYLHNGSVPTLANLLDSSTRPARFTRPPSTDFEHYDTDRVGWKYEELSAPIAPDLPRREAIRVYDTGRWGLSNDGHLFGDPLTDEQRTDLIEYLKTL